MQRLTQKERFKLLKYRNEALTAYLEFCVKFNETPRTEQILLINGCTSTEAFKKVIEIIKSN